MGTRLQNKWLFNIPFGCYSVFSGVWKYLVVCLCVMVVLIFECVCVWKYVLCVDFCASHRRIPSEFSWMAEWGTLVVRQVVKVKTQKWKVSVPVVYVVSQWHSALFVSWGLHWYKLLVIRKKMCNLRYGRLVNLIWRYDVGVSMTSMSYDMSGLVYHKNIPKFNIWNFSKIEQKRAGILTLIRRRSLETFPLPTNEGLPRLWLGCFCMMAACLLQCNGAPVALQ